MTRPPSRWVFPLGVSTAVVFLLALASSAIGLTAWNSSRMDRLKSMPLDHRRRLAANLHQFESLPRDQQASIRELDRQIEDADPEMRDRYRDLARRYYNWVQTLSNSDREALRAGSTSERLGLAQTLLERSTNLDQLETLDTALARGSSLNPFSLLDQVYLIQVWLALDTPQRQNLEQAAPADRVRLLEDLGKAHHIADFRPDLRRRADELFRDWTSPRGPNPGPFIPGGLRRFDALKAQSKGDYARRLMEYHVLSNTPIKPVEAAELTRLVDALPSWIRQSLDSLPPNAARERLRLIYRSLWPNGAMPPGIRPWIITPDQSDRARPGEPGGPPPSRRPDHPPPPALPGAPF